MPPFGPEKFVPESSDDEKKLRERREALSQSLYVRMLSLVEPKEGKGSAFWGNEKSPAAEYKSAGQPENESTFAWVCVESAEVYPKLSIRTMRGEPGTAEFWAGERQLTIAPPGSVRGSSSTGPKIVGDFGNPSELSDRQAVELLKMGVDTVELIEMARALSPKRTKY